MKNAKDTTKRQGETMSELKKLTQKLETIINEKMDKFAVIAKEVKVLQQNIKSKHLQMAKILKELEPAEFMVRQQNPDLCPLFDELKKIVRPSEPLIPQKENHGNQ